MQRARSPQSFVIFTSLKTPGASTLDLFPLGTDFLSVLHYFIFWRSIFPSGLQRKTWRNGRVCSSFGTVACVTNDFAQLVHRPTCCSGFTGHLHMFSGTSWYSLISALHFLQTTLPPSSSCYIMFFFSEYIPIFSQKIFLFRYKFSIRKLVLWGK